MLLIEGGVTAPQGFSAGAVHCGIRKNTSKKDLAVIYSKVMASAAAVYTQNKVFGAPITVTREHLENGTAQLMICNSGNANTCNADGIQIANEMSQLVADKFSLNTEDVIIASTGVIGQPLDITKIAKGIEEIEVYDKGSVEAAEAIMTTDLVMKEMAYEFKLSNGEVCKIGSIAKGSGMINPNMATMLAFVTTDVAISPKLLQKALTLSVEPTYNMVSVDGVHGSVVESVQCLENIKEFIAKHEITSICKKAKLKEVKLDGKLAFIRTDIKYNQVVDGQSNLERMFKGCCPRNKHNEKIEVHCIEEGNEFFFIELSKNEYQGKSYDLLHVRSISSRITQDEFTQIRKAYWKRRAMEKMDQSDQLMGFFQLF